MPLTSDAGSPSLWAKGETLFALSSRVFEEFGPHTLSEFPGGDHEIRRPRREDRHSAFPD